METYLTQITNYLLTQSWQIAILVVVIAVVNLALKNRSAHIRYLLWLIVLAKCLAPPLVTVPLAVLPQDKLPEPTLISNGEMPAVNVQMTDAVTSEPIAVPSLPVASPTIMERLARVTGKKWLGFGWIAGVAVFVVFAVIKALRTEFWLKCKRKLLPTELKCEIEDLFSDVGVRKFPKVWLVEGIGQPFVWGLLRGSIYLQADFVKENCNEHRRGVLGHELGHILRFDAAVNILQIIAQAIFWFHPFVWWANKKIRGEREKCCDEMAIAGLGAKAKDYSAAIVDTLVAEYKSARPVPSLAIAGPVRNIEDRIKTIMKPGKKFYTRPSLMALTVVLLLALLVVPTVLVLTARAGTKAQEAGSVAERTLMRDADISELSESNNKVTCTGKVLNARGEPIAGAKVTAYEMYSDGIAGNMLLRQAGEVMTAEDGAFIFNKPKLEKGIFIDCYIVAIKQNLALGWIEWGMRKDLESNIQLGEPTRFEGVIVDKAGKPVAGADVRANLYRTIETTDGEEKREWLPGIPPFRELITQTNRRGRFLFSNLPVDLDVDLLTKAEGKATIFTYQSEKSEPAFKTGQTGIRVVMPDEARIEGKILDPDTSRGMAGVKFAVVFTSSGVFFYRFVCTTDDNGQFSIGGLQNSEYLIRGRSGDPIPWTYVNAKSGQTAKITIGANKIYYGRILFEDGDPVVITPEPWPGAKTKINLVEKGKASNRSVVDIDKEGLFKVSLSQEQYQKLQSGKAWFEVTVPYTDKKAYLGEDVFAYDLLATDKTKASVAWIARPNSEPGSVVGRLLFEMKVFNIDLSQTSTQGGIILACFFDMQQRPSRYFLRELARRAKQLEQKGVTVVAIQTSKIDENALNKWVKNDNIPFAVGMVRGDGEKNKFDWGVESLPWLILTDRNRVVSAEGFGLSELYGKIEAVAEK
ncbi:MAG: M56 family metallopeptidase [Planctomycetota bacterium]|jgi:beta-lactamase regulating signal transducer with metallopeptidase domain